MKRIIPGITKPKPKAPETSFVTPHPKTEPQDTVIRRQVSVDPNGEVMVNITDEGRLQQAINDIPRIIREDMLRLGGARNTTPAGRALPIVEGVATDPQVIDRRVRQYFERTGRTVADALSQRFASGGIVMGSVSINAADIADNPEPVIDNDANVRIEDDSTNYTVRADSIQGGYVSGFGLAAPPVQYGNAVWNTCVGQADAYRRAFYPDRPEFATFFEAVGVMVRLLWPSYYGQYCALSIKESLLYIYGIAQLDPPEALRNAYEGLNVEAANRHCDVLLRDVCNALNADPRRYPI